MNHEFIALLANLALALSFIVGLIFGIAQVRAAARDRRERLTLEALRNFQTREFAELIFYIVNNKMPANQKEMETLPANDRIMFIQFAQQMESLGILVAEKLINIDLVDKTLGSLVTTAWDKYKIMFLTMRDRDPFIGEYFQWLAESIDKRLKENPRRPFYESALQV
ncbi:MAG TPA: hypothetical protein VK483_15400 [Chitinophagaceae bacterium]|nr:hypothetical protein [Chitinophagaceae bacterium]